MRGKICKDLVNRRIDHAKENLGAAKLLYNANSFKGANNRAYYSIFHSIRTIFALEMIEFKTHKEVLAYFNKNYVNPDIFPKTIGKRIMQAKKIQEDSDYDDEYVADSEVTKQQIETAEELINLVEKYIEKAD